MKTSSPVQSGAQETVSTEVITEVARTKGVDPMDLQPPLYDALNPEALNSLFRDRDSSPPTGQVTFRYNGCEVVVGSNGHVDVEQI